MAITLEVTNHETSTVSEGHEVIAIGFNNHGESFSILNAYTTELNNLNDSEQSIANAFIDMIRAKVLASGGSAGGGS